MRRCLQRKDYEMIAVLLILYDESPDLAYLSLKGITLPEVLATLTDLFA